MTEISETTVVSALRASMKQVERLRTENRELRAAQREPIAIVGMGCRYPGGVGSADQLWELVRDGRDAIGELPTDRGWEIDELFDPEPGVDGKTYTRWGGFLDGAGDFDAGFFGISPREALGMDPQQRLLLEVSWEALEDASIDPQRLRGTNTGVFAGLAAFDRYGPGGFGIPATAASVVSGRVAYALGLAGPAISVDTACSSSLVALHLACGSLRSGECELALAGGVTVMATPEIFVEFSRQRGLSPDGRCRSYGARAEGTGWGEGAGVVVLERLSRARELGHTVLGMVTGSAVNQDGASNGLTAPNGPAQQRVIRAALAAAGLGIGDVDVVEGHGTATRLGDPVEIGALLATYGRRGGSASPVWLGSVKSNVGHTQAAAGVAGVIKMVQAMRHGVLPKSLHCEQPSPHVDWASGNVRLLDRARDWETPEGRPRRAGVSSFGISGTNAHLILEQPPEVAPRPAPECPAVLEGPAAWALSARSAAALAGQARRLREFATAEIDLDTRAIGQALGGRAVFEHRAVVFGRARDELLTALAPLADDPSTGPDPLAQQLVSGTAAVSAPDGVVLVFGGQGSQWTGMGRELLAQSPVFAASMRDCEQALAPHVDWSLTRVLGDEDALARVDVVQPALWAVMVSLARVWQAAGVRVGAVVGHSQGEIAAACVAGVLSLPDAARVVALRARELRRLAGTGGMVAVQASPHEVRARLVDGIDIAAVNGPQSVVVSGELEPLRRFATTADAAGLRVRWLLVDYAAHSARIDALETDLATALGEIAPLPGSVELYSTVSGSRIAATELDTAYWIRNLRRPVLFDAAVRALLDDGYRTFLEVSPHALLLASITETGAEVDDALDGELVTVGSLRRGDGSADALLRNLAEAFVSGVDVDWAAVCPSPDPRPVKLPTYAFDRQRYWLPATGPATRAATGATPVPHPLLGVAVEEPGSGTVVLTGSWSAARHPWLADHAVCGQAVFPATGFVDLAIAAGDRVGHPILRELDVTAALRIPADSAISVRVVLGPPGAPEPSTRTLAIHSRPDVDGAAEEWMLNAEGVVAQPDPPARTETPDPIWPPAGARPVPLPDFYSRLAARGYEYGPQFQRVAGLWQRGEEVFAEAELLAHTATEGFGIHPALFDAILHAAVDIAGTDDGAIMLPFAWHGVALHATGATRVRAHIRPAGTGSIALTVTDTAGQKVVSVDSLLMRPLGRTDLLARSQHAAGLFGLHWVPSTPGPVERDTVTVVRVEPAASASPSGAHAVVAAALEQVRRWLAEGTGCLVVVTRGAVAAPGEAVTDPAGAAVWGLVRSARAETSARLVLADVDDWTDLPQGLPQWIGDAEREVAVRGGTVYVPRVVRLAAGARMPELARGTVLITGGTGGLGAEIARHLVLRHGVRRLVLASRRGPDADGADTVAAELADLGARVRVVSCDVTQSDSVRHLLAEIRAHDTLAGVVHAAGVLDDGVVESLSSDRLAAVLRPKVDGAWHLHRWTADDPPPLFALFSSAAGVLGSAGQAAYAAANGFLDGLASYRRAQGLPAVSVAWGLWERATGMTNGLGEADRSRIRRMGVAPMSTDFGSAVFDAVIAADEPAVLGVRWDMRALRAQSEQGSLPSLFGELVPSTRPRATAATALAGLRDRLASMSIAERLAVLLETVRAEAAGVLGFRSAEAVPADRSFRDLGLDSLGAVQLRDRVGRAVGLRLPASAVFDYPTPRELTRHVVRELSGGLEAAPAPEGAAPSDGADPVVIVGMGCRYPGGVRSADEFWQLVVDGRDAVGDFPADRGWDVGRLYDPEPGVAGRTYTCSGGFLAGVGDFDAGFFGISPREALGMDPQQRLLLEVAWEALEDAGIDPCGLRGSETGVFAGLMYHDYPGCDAASGSLASGRLSYALGLHGPALTVDTACSSSLVALHLASRSIRSGECELALAGGVTVMSTPEPFVEFSRQGGLSVDGRCRSFGAEAEGTGWGEGVGVVVLERLSRAWERGHTVLAVVAGSAVNQDGASNGLTAPNGPAQQRVIRAALVSAGLGVGDVDVVEGHGTATRLGDPIEVGALLATYGQRGGSASPVWLGSVKSNVGHTQAAAGVAGVIKMVQAMRHGVLPMSLYCEEPSRHVDWASGNVRLLDRARDWDTPEGRPRRAGVSSFGISGTNAHLILEQAPEPPPAPDVAAEPKTLVAQGITLWAMSARSTAALAGQAERLREFVTTGAGAGADLARVGWALTQRSAFEHRAVVLGSDRAALVAGLEQLTRPEHAATQKLSEIVTGRVVPGVESVVLVFGGQGSQWAGMGRQLLAGSPVFAASMRECERALAPHVDWSLTQALGDERLLYRVDVVQPALWAVMVSLARVWQSLGVSVGAVVGHSQGEIAAACVAGVLSIADAARVVAVRSRVLRRLAGSGGMAAVDAPQDAVRRMLLPGIDIAAVNGPQSIVVSGEIRSLDAFTAAAEGAGLRVRRLAVDYAGHSPQIDILEAELREALGHIAPRAAETAFYSTVIGSRIDAADLDTTYWISNLRRPVLFEQAVGALLADGYRCFLEVSPHPVLAAAVTDTAAVAHDGPVAVLASIRRADDRPARLLRSAAEAFVAGIHINWETVYSGSDREPVKLPPYAFDHERYWLATADSRAGLPAIGVASVTHPMLGAAVEDPGSDTVITTGRIALAAQPWLSDHAVLDRILVPGTVFVELAVVAADRVGCAVLRELTIAAPAQIPADGAMTVRVVVGPPDAAADGGRPIRIHLRPDRDDDSAWTLHAEGWADHADPAPPADPSASDRPPADAAPLDIAGTYAALAELGYDYGPAFRGLRRAWRRGSRVFAEVELPETVDESGFILHPALFDAILHPAIGDRRDSDTLAVPFTWRGVTVRAVGARRLRAEVVRDDAEVIAVRAVDDLGRPVLSVDALVTRPLDPSTLRSAPRNIDPLLGVRWDPAPAFGADDIAAAALQVVPAPDGDVVAETHTAVSRMLAALQQWPLDDERRLVVVTQGAIAMMPGESVNDLAGAAVWGLVRSAQVERPDRIVLVDTDDREGVRSRIGALAAVGEPELVVRHGQVFVPRVVRIESPAEAAPLVSGGTVLITGGTGGVGAAVARHLVAEHGVRQLVLVSRRGPAAAGAAELTADLVAAGATVRVLSCDVAQRNSLDAVLAEIRAEGALVGVVHAAGVLDDGVLESQDAHRIDGVLRPKVDGAWHLHQATLADDLILFVLFSSVAGVLGSAGQTGYAAANRFLDALAGHRRGLGLPAVSVAWGWWAVDTGMTGRLGDTDRERIRRAGLTPMPTDRALALFDRAVHATEPVVLAAALDPKRLRAQSDTPLPPVLADLVATQRAADPGRVDANLRDRLRGLDDEGRRDLILDLVRTHAATVLGHRGGDAIDLDTSFRDQGFDSLDAVGFRDRLGTAVGLRLPAGAVFDYPTPRDLVRFLVGELTGRTESAAAPPAAGSARAADDPVVIVGMSCRFPGGANSPGRLWDVVAEGRDVVAAFPDDRGWDLAALYGAEPDETGAARPRQGGFLYDAADFDAAFFGISPREALGMDPQQRLLLEVSWEAVESAGIDPHLLRGSRTGIFAGVASPQRYGSGGFGIPATAASVVSGRVAYVLGLEGPAITVDTACSSSLVALHLAAGSIRSGECDLALAGGVTVMSSPEVFVEFARQQGLSPDGRCRSYCEHADGTGWAEGVGVVLIERLSRANELGHRVLAMVAGSAVNQDGASNGLTAPNGPSQQRVIRAALAAARLGVEDVDVVEGHGTGTRLGDPIEIDALMATYGQRDPALEPLRLGSVKSNMGHAQAAAGIAGVIKMVMAMRHGIMPRSLYCDLPSTQVDWQSARVRLLAEPREWTVPSGRPRRAAVSSFGISGTNAHLVLEQAPSATAASPAQPPSPPGSSLSAPVPGSAVEPPRSPAVSAPGALAEPPSPPASGAEEATEPVAAPTVWLVSARSRGALAGQAARLREFAVGAGDGVDPARIGWSSTRRSAFEHRAVVVGRDRAELVRGLSAVADSTYGTPVVSGRVDTGGAVWMFPGQGSQRLGVGRELYAAFPGFAAGWDEAVAAVDALLSEALRSAGARSLTDVVWGDEARRLERTTFAQPALFATGIAAARLWQSWGMRPDAMIGHSVGEITAACVAGVLSLPDAARVVAARARLMGELPAGGAMAALNVPEGEAAQTISEIGDAALSLAAVNAPRSVVVSGPEPAVAAVVARMRAAGRSARMLAVSHAFHSPAMTPMLDRFAEEIAGIDPRPARVRVVCGETGTIIGTNEPPTAFDAAYWADRIVRPVRFRDGITGLYRAGMRHFAELGPGRALTAAVTETLDGAGTEDDAIGSAWSAQSALHDPACAEIDALIAAAGRLWSVGRAVDWAQLFPPAARHWVELPTYAFERQRYWLERADGPASGAGGIVHALLGRVLHSPDGRVTMVGRLSPGAQRWLAEHRVAGRLLFPGTGFVELALSAGAAVGAPVLRELTLSAPLPVPDSGAVEVHVVVAAADAASHDAARTLTIHSRPASGGADEEWTLHAEGIVDQRVSSPATAEWAEVWPPDGAVAMPVEDAYERLADAGYEYGPLFRGMRGAWRRGTELFAEVALPGTLDVSGYGVHPALLDACLHPLLLTGDTVVVPFDWTGVSVGACVAGTLRVRSVRTGDLRVGVQAVDSDGEPVLTIEGVTGRPARRHAATLPAVSNSLSEVRWRPAPSTDGVAPPRNTVRRRLVHDGVDAPAAAADVVVLDCRAGASGPEVLARAHASTVAVVDWVRTWLSRNASGSRLLVVVPDHDAEPEGAAGLAAAAIRGAVRSAQAEHPGRIVLVNSAVPEIDPLTVLEAGEAEVALRAGAVWVPRLVRVRAGGEPPDIGGGTVLITGGTGGLGAAVARHLVRAHQVGELVLVSRRGAAAPGADDLVRELEDLGARVSVVACDVADATAVRAVVAGIGPEAPLIGVVHAAGVLDDGVLDSLTAPRIEAVLRPKVDGAWHLHEQIGTRELRFFLLFSSVSGLLGGPGQANYAAANAFLDALARYRRARGLCATAVAWGPWAETGMAAQRAAAPHGPLGAALPTDRALAILDATLSLDTAAVVGCLWDSASFDSAVPAVLTELVRTPPSVGAADRSARPAELRTMLREMTPPQQVGHLLAVIRQQAAIVLGHTDNDAIDARSAFADLGFDSLSAVQFRNALAAATGSTLSAGLVFDHPTPVALAEFLRTTLIGEPDPDDRDRAVDEALNRLEALLAAADDGARVGAHIRERILRITATRDAPAGPPADADIAAMSGAELLSIIDHEL